MAFRSPASWLIFALAAASAYAAAPGPLPAPITLAGEWLMQDVIFVKDSGADISKPGYAPPIYTPVPYRLPPSAALNAPGTGVQPDSVRFAAYLGKPWPAMNAEPSRPNLSSFWAAGPRPVSLAWYRATVPGTVLTTLVNNQVYPEPLYGENNRPNLIPDSLCRTTYWYRTEFAVPAGFAGQHVWLNFEGINYLAEVWVNGTKAGNIRGAFMRGEFDITALVRPGEKAGVAVYLSPPPNAGDPWEKTVANGRGPNGGILSKDGPTFLASMGWDWIPGIRDRDMGIWQKVTVSATGPVLVVDPFVTTDLPLPSTASADVTIETRVKNVSDTPQTGVVTGTLGEISFQSGPVTVPAGGTQVVRLTPATTPALRISNPRLWWPNGFGEPSLYPLKLSFAINGTPSDTKALNVGIRKVSYFVDDAKNSPPSKNLTLSVNGVPIFAMGGNWGMDEAMKRVPRERLEAQIRLHRDAHYTILRNWVGQSTSEDLFDLCDQYGIMVWDEFFEPNPSNNGRPWQSADATDDVRDIPLYLANVRDTLLRYRNHPSIVIWCGRNEGDPPPELDRGNAAIVQELDPTRYYQSSSTSGNGVISNGPYHWQLPKEYYTGESGNPGNKPLEEAFKTEIGSASIPTLEALQAMLPEKDWFDKNFPNDAWAEHDLVTGNGNPASFPFQTGLAQRFGPYRSLPEFSRKAQLADYETFRAMYEAHLSRLFAPCTALITWMSVPAQPCLVWQIIDYSLEPFGSYFAVQKACEPVHIMMTQDNFHVILVNHTPQPLAGLTARVRVLNLDGTVKLDQKIFVPEYMGSTTLGPGGKAFTLTPTKTVVPASFAADLGSIPFPTQLSPGFPSGLKDLSPVHFVKLELLDAAGKVISDNFYWHETKPDDFTALDQIADVTLDSRIVRHDAAGKILLEVTLTNATKAIAVMAHVQLRNQRTNARVLPVYYSENYLSLLPGESRTITIEAAAKDLGADEPLVMLDGWNVTTKAQSFTTGGLSRIAPNTPALVPYAVRRPNVR